MPRKATHKKINSQKDYDHFREFINEFKSESDRAAVILGAAKLDNILYQILGSVLLPPPSGNDELLEGDSPLSTFSSRINITYRLGLIDAEFARTLHLIRRIRNSFAHEVSGANMNSGAHVDRIRELSSVLRHYKEYASFQKTFFEGDINPSTDFKSILVVAMVRLTNITDSHSHSLTIHNKPLGIRPERWTESKSTNKATKKPTPKALTK
jgi:hypothetical protein